jgi:hypothetical protein
MTFSTSEWMHYDAVLRRAVKVLINVMLSAVGAKWNGKIWISPIFRETREGGS